MLDINYIRDNPEVVKQACRDKQLDESIIDQLLVLDAKRRDFKSQGDKIRQEINANAQVIKEAVHHGQQPDQQLVEKGKGLREQLKKLNDRKEEWADYERLLYSVPNVPAKDVPVGADENDNQVQNTVGELPKFEFEPKSHHQLMVELDMLETKRAVKMAGFRSYFLKNEAVLLEQALLKYSLDYMIKQGFTPLTTPVMVNEAAMLGTGYFPWGQEDHYVTQDGKILTGTAEVALTAFHQDEILNEKDLPVKLVGISSCFRREVGSYGKDTKGVFRVHQFNKIEQMVLTVADEAETRQWHQKMLEFSEKILQDLELPYQVVLMCTKEMGAGQRKKYDIETWFPYQQKYRETHSASYFNDFQSRRLNMRYRSQDGSTKFVYTLNNTVAASPRMLAAMIENHQQADGSVRVPAVLQDLTGLSVISSKK